MPKNKRGRLIYSSYRSKNSVDETLAITWENGRGPSCAKLCHVKTRQNIGTSPQRSMNCRLQWPVDYASMWHYGTQQHWRTIFLLRSPHSFAGGTWKIQKYLITGPTNFGKSFLLQVSQVYQAFRTWPPHYMPGWGMKLLKSLFSTTLDGHLRYILFHDSIILSSA